MNLLAVDPFGHFEVAALSQSGEKLLLFLPSCGRHYFSFVELSGQVFGGHLIVITAATGFTSLILLDQWHSPDAVIDSLGLIHILDGSRVLKTLRIFALC